MNIKNFDNKIKEMCEQRNIPHSRSIITTAGEISGAEYSFNEGTLFIRYNKGEVKVTSYRGPINSTKNLLFDWDSTQVRIKENIHGFEIKFDIPTPEDTFKLKLFVTGGDKIPMNTRKVGDPLKILMENPEEWMDILDLSKMTKLTRQGVAQRLRDINTVELKRTYIGNKRHASYYRYVPAGSQKDSEPVSSEE